MEREVVAWGLVVVWADAAVVAGLTETTDAKAKVDVTWVVMDQTDVGPMEEKVITLMVAVAWDVEILGMA